MTRWGKPTFPRKLPLDIYSNKLTTTFVICLKCFCLKPGTLATIVQPSDSMPRGGWIQFPCAPSLI